MNRIIVAVAVIALFTGCAKRATSPTALPAPKSPAVAPMVAMVAEPATLAGSAFVPACDIPFGSIGQVRDIDNSCSPDGQGSDKSKLQNKAKNDFCASGPIVDINRQVLERLQKNVDDLENFEWGSPTHIPADRSPLKGITTVNGQAIGEGSRVRVRAYFMHATFSNTSNGENVNCSVGGQANNDIHIYLSMIAEEDDRCESLNAEISPHFRPEAWLDIVGLDISPKRPLRITGQLFFDASHQPCRPNKRQNPNRFTSWEIHPFTTWRSASSRALPAAR